MRRSKAARRVARDDDRSRLRAQAFYTGHVILLQQSNFAVRKMATTVC
jgi:hypothetical protein